MSAVTDCRDTNGTHLSVHRENTTIPERSSLPWRAGRFASQATERTGLARTWAPAADETTSPSTSRIAPISDMPKARNPLTAWPCTKREARQAGDVDVAGGADVAEVDGDGVDGDVGGPELGEQARSVVFLPQS